MPLPKSFAQGANWFRDWRQSKKRIGVHPMM
jgi:hypothetical protein